MKILIVVDKTDSAIDRLAQEVVKNAPEYDIKVLPIHPKKADGETLYELGNLLNWCDILDIHYWKIGEIIKTTFPKEFEAKPKVLFHFNPYDIDKQKWEYDQVVVGNKSIHNKAPYAFHIPYCVDLDFFKYNEEYTEENRIVNMVVGRIESNKKVLEVAQACKEIGAKLRLIGRVSSGPYMQQVLDTGAVEFFENVTEDDLYKHYKEATIHVCNSVDNFESGTLPILEAMATGVPVLTRNTGHVPDLNNGKNMLVRKGKPDDLEDLKKSMLDLLDNREWRLKLREAAFNTVRKYSSEIMVRRIFNIYKRVYQKPKPMVSVIIPTKDNPEAFIESLVGAVTQDYDKYEVIVSDSGETSVKRIVEAARGKTKVPIKYIRFTKQGYTLPEARNRAVVEAFGDLLVFCDDRLKMEKQTVNEFVNYSEQQTWLWGVKDNSPKAFVENLSAVFREDLIKGGMFNERIAYYGGATQDIKQRFENFSFQLIDRAKATSVKRAKSKKSRRSDIIKAKLILQKLYE
jgi:glycosyltransferase involved in cell wall biosynthesis